MILYFCEDFDTATLLFLTSDIKGDITIRQVDIFFDWIESSVPLKYRHAANVDKRLRLKEK